MITWIKRRRRQAEFRRIARILYEAEDLIDGFPLPPPKPNGEAAIVINLKSASGSRRLYLTDLEKTNASAICHALGNIALWHAGEEFEGITPMLDPAESELRSR
jgi:hypothetical protein